MTENTTKKRQTKWNILDVIIVVALVAALALGWLYLQKQHPQSVIKTTLPITYTYEARNVNEAFATHIVVGETVYNSSRNYPVGKVTAVRVEPFKDITENKSEGVFVLAEDPGKRNVIITIAVDATEDDYNYYAGQENIKVGHMFPIKGKGFASNGFVIGIEEGSND